jgi:L-lactate dehydrogenase complex protein LldE
VRGTELVELTGADICCGFGGTFANSFADVSTALVRQKAAYFIDSGADLLVMCDPGCLLNIQGYLDRNHPGKRALHLADFLADSLVKKARVA